MNAIAEMPALKDELSLPLEHYHKLREWLVAQIAPAAGERLGLAPANVDWVKEQVGRLLTQKGVKLVNGDAAKVIETVTDDTIGYGPIGPYLRDPTVSEVMVNGPELTYIERGGKLIETDVRFRDYDHVMQIIERIVKPLGRTIDRKRPLVDARLPDGSRVNAIIPPSALNGPTITIRKFPAKRLSVQDLIGFGSLTQHMADFLQACVVARLNTVVAGGTGSGKTTLLNVLSSFIPDDERIVTVEDSAELQLQQKHVVRLETVPALPEGGGQVTIRDLVINALRMRPERIVVGECRGGEAIDMLQAMNTGHDGSLTTVHANTPRDVISRLETMVLMAGFDLPVRVVRQQIAAAVDLIVQQERLSDGSRKVTRITEVQGMEGENIVLSDVFLFQAKAISTETGKVEGEMKPTGIRPNFSPRLQAAGFKLTGEMFGVGAAGSMFKQGQRR
ncbi:MAG TPA: CpaF family protein [Anaerolineae bacterium]|nr:CpaF family protein [Anaerolineae bacterium]